MNKLLKIMGWNIENYGTSKHSSHGTQLNNFIAQVINENEVDIAAFSEMRSNLAATIGTEIASRLDTLQGLAAGTWRSQPSIQFVPGRLEQYLFVWNSDVTTTYNGATHPATGNAIAFQWLFDDPNKPGKKIGFPRQIKGDRPPYLGYFQKTDSNAKNRQVLVAVMHSPGPGFQPDTKSAAKNMARITEFREKGDTCVVVGDFNVKYQTDQTVAHSYGEAAFGSFIASSFSQAMNPIDAATSLIDAAYWTTAPAMVAGDYQNQPYDQVFFRTTGASPPTVPPGNLQYDANNGVYTDDVIQDCINTEYLATLLAAIADTYSGNAIGTTVYGNDINSAFVDYRRYVSDHLPVFIQVDE